MRAIAVCGAQALLALALSYVGAACVAAAAAERPHRTLALQWDNDSFFSDNDLHYTNGLGLSYLWVPDPDSAALERVTGALRPVVPGAVWRFGVAIGQSMFTPDDIARTDIIFDDQPYAGWTYLGFAVVSHSDRSRGPVAGDLESFELILGVAGPPALAGDLQIAWHEFMEITRPRGWDHQLGIEPGLVLAYTRQWRFCTDIDGVDCRTDESGAASVDWIPYLGGALGNVYTYLAAGATVRLGKGLRSDFNHSRIRPGLPAWSFGTPADGFNWHVFFSAEGRLVGRNIFLDGNTFRDSHSVSRRAVVGDFEAGFTMSWDIALPGNDVLPISMTYRHLIRTPEFYGQRGIDNIDSLNIAVSF